MNAKIFATLVAIVMSIGILPAKAGVELNQVSTAGISVKITPLASESGTQKVYMGAFLPVTPGSVDGKWYLRDTAGNWLFYQGGPLPVALNMPLPPPSNTPYYVASIADIDISALEGLQVWVAYGASEQAALADAQHVQKIYTVPSKKVLHYTEKVYALWPGYPAAVTQSGVAKVTNLTPYTTGALPLFNCWMAEKPLADGKVLVNCQDAVTLNRHLLYLDPTIDALYEYETAPQVWDPTVINGKTCGWCSIVNYPAGTVWQDFGNHNPANPASWGMEVRVSGGWYFTSTNRLTLSFQPDQGGATVIKAADYSTEGTFHLLMTYSN